MESLNKKVFKLINMAEKTKEEAAVLDRVETPRRFKVILLNDDFTPMDFVIYVLKRFFSKNNEEAEKIMMEVHEQGRGLAGVYSLEVAEMKVHQTNHFARQNQHPLKTVLEEE